MLSTLVLTAVGVALAAPSQADSISWRRLEAAATFDGVSCAPTGRASAGFFANGRLHGCPIAADTTIEGHRLAAGTWIYFTDDGALWRAWLVRNTELGGVLCKGTGYKGWSVEFHATGKLAMCYLAREQVIDGVTCRKGSFWGEVTGGVKTYFEANGRLRSCARARGS
jgi:hypothetical protein